MIDPTLLSPTAADVLTAAGWAPGRDIGSGQSAQWRLRYTVAFNGIAASVPGGAPEGCWNEAADAIPRAFGGLAVTQSGAGVDLARNSFVLDPLLLERWARPLAIRDQALGTVLAPLGHVENNAAIAVTSDSCVFLVDHRGEWAYGEGLEQGLSDLIDGVQPLTRLAL
jgi:hypothetical protein